MEGVWNIESFLKVFMYFKHPSTFIRLFIKNVTQTSTQRCKSAHAEKKFDGPWN